MRLTSPWYFTFRAITVREKDRDRIAVVKNGETGRIPIGPNESKHITCYTDKEVFHQPTLCHDAGMRRLAFTIIHRRNSIGHSVRQQQKQEAVSQFNKFDN